MRRILIIALVALIPLAAFSQTFQIGPTAFFDFPMTPADAANIPLKEIGLDDFTFGADARFRLFKILEVSGLALFSPPAFYEEELYYVPGSIDIFADAGVYLGFGIIGAGIGVGPNFRIPIDTEGVSDDVFQLGFNTKIHADVNLGKIGVSLNYLMYLPELSKEAFDALGDNLVGSVGVSVLFNI